MYESCESCLCTTCYYSNLSCNLNERHRCADGDSACRGNHKCIDYINAEEVLEEEE